MAKRGMNVVIISRTKDKLDNVAKEIGDTTGREVKVLVADFTKDDAFENIEDELKKINVGVLVNNVGILVSTLPRKFLECPDLDQVITKVINCNVKTMTKMCKIILPGMVQRGKGVILNMSSGTASVPFPLYTLYSASKIYVERFSQSLQAEYRDKGIIIQVITPFGISTKMTCFQPTNTMILSPQDFVNTALLYLRAGDKIYGSLGHTLVGWLLCTIPHNMLFSESMQTNLQKYLERVLHQKKSHKTEKTQ
ncbi:hypothetical protein WMY93_005171 [Mugilogobius chulae]|uniref:Uncharacterized protein n=1 Tax=Mugilogobius chulae TaxID=88201 RepID=A0AAW0PWI2_9GOBI